MRTSKKIAIIASFPESLLGFRLQLIQALLARGDAVIAIAPAHAEVEKKLAAINVKMISAPIERNGLNPFSDIVLCATLYKILKHEKPDSVLSYTVKPIVYGSIAAKCACIKNIYSMVTGTGYVFLNENFKSKIVGFIARVAFSISLRCNTAIFFQNKDNAALFQEKKLFSRKQKMMVVNGSGVDCHIYQPADYPKEISFLMIARLLYDKGVAEYVEAAKMLKKKYPAVRCELAGWVDTNPNAISQATLDQWIKEKNIIFLGKLDDVRLAIKNVSVYVLPSYHEGMPRTVLEAMAMARPIITTDVAGCRDTVIENQNGFLVPVKNSKKLADAMEYFLLHPTRIAEMGLASRAFALEKFDVHKVNNAMMQVL